MSTEDIFNPTPAELKREAKRIMREQHINFTKAMLLAYKSLKLGNAVKTKGEL